MVKRRRRSEEGAPQFFKIILSPHASKLHIPDEFIMDYGADLGDVVILEVPTCARWEVKLQHSNGMTWLKEGWNPFQEYYSIGCGYFLLFQYNGNSHFSVFIFDLSASEIEYPSGPNEEMTPENVVDTAGYTSHRKKADGTETKNNTCDEIMDGLLTNNTTGNSINACDKIVDELPMKKTAKDIKVNACDEVVDDLPTSKAAKDSKVNARDEIVDDFPTNKTAKNNEVIVCDEFVDDVPNKKTANDNKVNARCDEIVGDFLANKATKDNEVNACVEIVDDLMGKKTSKDDKVADESYSRRQKSGVPLSFPSCLPDRQDPSMGKLEPDVDEDLYCAAQKGKKQEIDKEKLEKQNTEKNLYCAVDKGTEPCNKVPDLFAYKMTEANQQYNKRKYSISLEASYCRYPLQNKQAKVVKLEEQDMQQSLYCEASKFKEHCNDVPIVDLSASKMGITNQLRSNQLKEVKLEQRDAASKTMVVNQHNEKKTSTSLNALRCRYPLRSKQLKEVKLKQQDAATNQPNEEKITSSFDALCGRYPLRSDQLQEVKLEQRDAASKTAIANQCNGKKTSINLDASKAMITNQHNEKKITTLLGTSRCRYPLRSKHLKEVKLKQREVQGNMHSLQSKDTVEADPSYCKRQESCLPVLSPSCRPQRKEAKRVKLEKPDMEEDLFCAAQKEKTKETNNVKLEKGDVGWNLYNTAFKVKDPPASKMTNTNQHNEGNNFSSLETSRCRYLLRSKLEQPGAEKRMHYLEQKIEEGCDGVNLAEKQLSTATCQVKSVNLREDCSRSGNPYFIVSMQPTYVSRSFQLNIPANFIKRSSNEEETIVTLRVSDGRTWDAKCSFYSNCAKIKSPGWRDFVRDNGLKVHDTCVFEMTEGIKPVLLVTIFRAMTPVP